MIHVTLMQSFSCFFFEKEPWFKYYMLSTFGALWFVYDTDLRHETSSTSETLNTFSAIHHLEVQFYDFSNWIIEKPNKQKAFSKLLVKILLVYHCTTLFSQKALLLSNRSTQGINSKSWVKHHLRILMKQYFIANEDF